MTAIRVIDDHQDLENVGSITHQQLDDYIDNTKWIVGPGSNPTPASSLTITAGDGIDINASGNQIVVSNADLRVENTTGVTWHFMETPSGVVNDSNVIFVLNDAPLPPRSLMLFVNGVLQVPGADADYLLSGNVITMTYPPLPDSKISATYTYRELSISWMELVMGDVDDINMIFTLAYSPNPAASLMFFVNGILQIQDVDYILTGKNVALFVAPSIGSNLTATYQY